MRHMCRTLVYAKPLQCRTHRVDRAKDNNSVAGHCSRSRDFATLLDGRCERDLVGRQPKPLCQTRCRAAAHPWQRTQYPMINERFERSSNLRGIFVRENTDDRQCVTAIR